MSNYLEEIENAYSLARGKQSYLSSLDWALAQNWEEKDIPLRIVLRAMGEVAENFKAKKTNKTIKTLSYFQEEVNAAFAEWLKTQVGKNTGEKDMPFAPVMETTIDILEKLVRGFTKKELPEPLLSATQEIRRNLILLIEEANEKQLTDDAIENRLKEMEIGLTLPLVSSISEDEQTAMVENINAEYSQITLDKDSRAKLLNRRLYNKFNLPKLTLYEL